MIRVSHVITGLAADGAERMLRNLVTRMDRRRFSNEVISLTTLGELGGDLRDQGISVRALGLTKNPASFGALSRMKHLFEESRPDIVQTWMYHADLLGGVIAQWAGVRRVSWGVHHSALVSGDKFLTMATAKLCALLSGSVPHCIICCSEASRVAHSAYGYRSAKTQLIPNGFDTSVFRPDVAARAEMRAELGVGEEDQLVGLASRLHPHKDHATFLAAAQAVLNQHPKAMFVLCGRGVEWTNPEFAALLRQFDLRDRVRLLGPTADMRRFYVGMDIMVSSSRTEAFPLAVGESMACGIPCVVTHVGDSAMIVGDTGLVVPPKDSTALAQAIEQLLYAGPEFRRSLGSSARCRVQRMFSLDATVARYQDLYTSAVFN